MSRKCPKPTVNKRSSLSILPKQKQIHASQNKFRFSYIYQVFSKSLGFLDKDFQQARLPGQWRWWPTFKSSSLNAPEPIYKNYQKFCRSNKLVTSLQTKPITPTTISPDHFPTPLQCSHSNTGTKDPDIFTTWDITNMFLVSFGVSTSNDDFDSKLRRRKCNRFRYSSSFSKHHWWNKIQCSFTNRIYSVSELLIIH